MGIRVAPMACSTTPFHLINHLINQQKPLDRKYEKPFEKKRGWVFYVQNEVVMKSDQNTDLETK